MGPNIIIIMLESYSVIQLSFHRILPAIVDKMEFRLALNN